MLPTDIVWFTQALRIALVAICQKYEMLLFDTNGSVTHAASRHHITMRTGGGGAHLASRAVLRPLSSSKSISTLFKLRDNTETGHEIPVIECQSMCSYSKYMQSRAKNAPEFWIQSYTRQLWFTFKLWAWLICNFEWNRHSNVILQQITQLVSRT